MPRFILTVLLTCTVAVLLSAPASAADPVVKKAVVAQDDGTTVLKIEVSASSLAIYGVTLVDDTGSITDIIAPKGWVGISSGDRVMFRAGADPIVSGKTVAFRVMTTNASAPLGVTFRDVKSPIHSKQTL